MSFISHIMSSVDGSCSLIGHIASSGDGSSVRRLSLNGGGGGQGKNYLIIHCH